MRWINKSPGPPYSLQAYIQLQTQLEVVVNLDYSSFPDKRALRRELTLQQYGLCAFTGVGIDERLGALAPDGSVTTASGKSVRIKAHIAHLKSQRQCREELVASGKTPGTDLGEDLDYRNMVAALLLEGKESELFGAAAQQDWWHLTNFVSPTDPSCEQRFDYGEFGTVRGMDAAAEETILHFRLGHATLEGWRSSAIRTFIDPNEPACFTVPYLRDVVTAMETPEDEKLPEYCFVVKHVAERLLMELAGGVVPAANQPDLSQSGSTPDE